MASSSSNLERESNDGVSDGGGSSSRREGSTAASANGSNSKKRKKNATMACNTCRRKRNRCIVDEGANVCRGCKASGQDCQFAEFDKRRDGIQELREKLSFYESMFETLKNGGSNHNHTDSLTRHHAASSVNGGPPTAAFDHAMDQQQGLHESFDYLVNGNGNNNSGSSSASNNAFFETIHGSSDTSAITRTVTPQSSIRSKRPRESPREEIINNGSAGAGSNGALYESHRPAHSHTNSNDAVGGQQTSRPQTTPLNGNTYEESSRSHPERSSSTAHPSTLRRASGRTPDMSAVMDHLAVESNGLIRAYGATSEIALAGFEDLPNQKTVFSTRRYHSALNSKDPPREVTPPADVQPLQTSALVAAAANISALPLGTDIRTVQHLLHLYFLWAWPMFPVISRQIFMLHFSNGGQYYSPLLLNVCQSF